MSKYLETSRKALPFSVYLTNTVLVRKRTTEDFRRMENMMWNCFGPPMFELRLSLKDPNKCYYKRNKDAVWQRFRNEFLFKDAKIKSLTLSFLPDEYAITKKII
jgi:hypothetical protein